MQSPRAELTRPRSGASPIPMRQPHPNRSDKRAAPSGKLLNYKNAEFSLSNPLDRLHPPNDDGHQAPHKDRTGRLCLQTNPKLTEGTAKSVFRPCQSQPEHEGRTQQAKLGKQYRHKYDDQRDARKHSH
ncbi:unnamed protein product [Protopolystoma xenopodis]|uniref:Uncharacterized protein n=1 Tax=Protopolystoma xenopodis TaxID=117903 RepID=A0A3S5AU73_9PLAT|nr:unnamed protein product [Protopolystoma xenopodis]